MEVTMKKLFVILFVILAGLLLFSCKSSTSPDNDVDLDTLLNKDVIAVFYSNDYIEETYAYVTVKQDVSSDVTILVNGVESSCYLASYTDNGRIKYDFGLAYIDFGETFSYVIKVDGNQFSGTLKHPDRYEPTCPPFDINNDYTLYWNIASNPQYQFADYYVSGNTSGEWDTLVGSTEIKPSARQHTFKKSIWNTLENIRFIEVWLHAYNTKTHGKQCTVAAYSGAFFYIHDGGEWKTNEGSLPKGAEFFMNWLNK